MPNWVYSNVKITAPDDEIAVLIKEMKSAFETYDNLSDFTGWLGSLGLALGEKELKAYRHRGNVEYNEDKPLTPQSNGDGTATLELGVDTAYIPQLDVIYDFADKYAPGNNIQFWSIEPLSDIYDTNIPELRGKKGLLWTTKLLDPSAVDEFAHNDKLGYTHKELVEFLYKLCDPERTMSENELLAKAKTDGNIFFDWRYIWPDESYITYPLAAKYRIYDIGWDDELYDDEDAKEFAFEDLPDEVTLTREDITRFFREYCDPSTKIETADDFKELVCDYLCNTYWMTDTDDFEIEEVAE